MSAHQHKKMIKAHQAGFTLIEVMIAVVIFSVGMMAALMLQFGAIDAYSASRDQTVGADVAQRAEALLRMETKRQVTNTAFLPGSSFVQASFEQTMTNAPWTWQALTVNPVDERMTNQGNARYCIFARGDVLNTALDTVSRDAGMGAFDQADLLRAHIAVVYPGANRDFRRNELCADVFASACGSTAAALLDPAVKVGVDDSIDECGLRAIYTSTLIKL